METDGGAEEASAADDGIRGAVIQPVVERGEGRTARGEQSDAPLEWGFNPWRERPGVSAVAAVVALAMCMLVLRLDLSVVFAFGLCVVAVSAFSPLLTPARCRVDEAGVSRRGALGWSRRAWRDIRRAVAHPAGLLVSPFDRPHWLDPYRSLFLPFPASRRDSLKHETRRRLESHGF